jgi:hypothetical protein
LEGIFSAEFAEDLPYDESLDHFASVFDVQPGQMLTWPQSTPHRVTNLSGMNVSLSTEHKNARALRRTNVHLANQFLRRTFGLPCRSMEVDGPAAHAKQWIIRLARLVPIFNTEPKQRGNTYSVTFKVDADAPLGYTLLDKVDSERPEPIAV